MMNLWPEYEKSYPYFLWDVIVIMIEQTWMNKETTMKGIMMTIFLLIRSCRMVKQPWDGMSEYKNKCSFCPDLIHVRVDRGGIFWTVGVKWLEVVIWVLNTACWGNLYTIEKSFQTKQYDDRVITLKGTSEEEKGWKSL